MAKFGYLYLRKGVWEGKQLLPPDWIDKVTRATVDPHAPGEPELRYSNFFWVLPDKHVYMAAGYHGQVIMVFPDLDVVAVTTGRDNYPLSELPGYISSSVKSDTALPPDASSVNLLANKVLDVSTEKPTRVGATPKMAAIISGKAYRFPPNAMNLKSLSLILTDPQPHYDMEIYTRDTTKPSLGLTGPIGLDGLYRKGEPTYLQALAIRRVNAVKGAWQDDHTFVIDRLILGQGKPAERWTLKFDGEKLNVRVELGEGPEIAIDSETAMGDGTDYE